MNPLKTNSLEIFRSRTLMPIFPNMVLDGTAVERVTELKVLNVVLDAKPSFEGRIWSIAASASGKLGIIRKALCLFGDPVLVLRCFWSFLFLVLEYCSSIWMSAASFHLGLLDCVVSKAVRLMDRLVLCNLEHRRRFAALRMFYKIYCNHNHAL